MDLNKEEIKKVELRSTEVQEVLGRPPKWIIRWGITIIFIVVGIILIGSWFFKYPDIVSAKISLTTENPPAPVIAKVNGRIQNLYVKNNDKVTKQQALGVIENPAKYSSVDSLIKSLSEFRNNFVPETTNLLKYSTNELGEIQANYALFLKYTNNYNNSVILNYHEKKIELSEKELRKYDEYLKNIKIQHGILKEDLELKKKQYKRDSILFKQELMSESDYEVSKANLLSKRYSFEQNNLAITNTEIQIESIKQSILELNLQKEKQYSDLENILWESYENLLTSIESWKHKYVLIAPTDGIVTFNKFWNENQTVTSGEKVLTIIPANEGEIIGKVKLDFQGAGKVKVGQLANIQFANYPYLEFGMVKGIVRSISLAPNNNYYTVELELPNGLETFYGIKLNFKQEMQGSAEIVTEDIRLLERIIRPLRYILKKNTNFGTS